MAAVKKVLDPAANKQTSLTTMNPVSGVFYLLCLLVLGFGCIPSWWQAPVVGQMDTHVAEWPHCSLF